MVSEPYSGLNVDTHYFYSLKYDLSIHRMKNDGILENAALFMP